MQDSDTRKKPDQPSAQPASRPRRSDATRAAILAAARERFAADGYERATIRAIAKDAGIDPSMVMRYYGSKEGLFAAAADIDLNLPAPMELRIQPAEHADPARTADVGRFLVSHFLDRWEQDEVLTALLRVGATNPAGAERMQQILKDQIGPVAARVCPDPADAPRRAALVASQVLGMALARFVLRFPLAVEMSKEEIVDWLAPTVQRYLTAPEP
ncbi:TetR family transcriptional regulator [Streptomyces indicus]|uniref:DNA-binding transcriptional regulator, AcrR family n=1 Tax=Streptomyces indicus TaxID=417292 RepID=A0A1G9ICH4_9ACTN|nr:TetR family transcriptional regulator [Streptomyces indicus]SDL22554.1 DNA-binding transcriptional regulator, AcrR family [Streptomyces indicus]